MKDLYDILGVKKSASDAEVKSAYRKLAKELHPDRNPDDAKIADRFKTISAAYSILGDKDKRKSYDRGEIDSSGAQQGGFGQGFGGGRGGPAGNPFGGGYGGGSPQDFEDIMRQFGGAAGGPQGAHYEFHTGPSGGSGGQAGGGDFFSDLFRGFGGGQKKPSGGRRSPLKGQDSLYALEIEFEEAIKGTTKRLKLENGKTVDVKIPAGVKDKQQIRLSGQGSKSLPGAAKGDALIEVRIKSHSFYRRDGRDIHMEIPITIDEAILGASISIPTIWGTVSMKIPKGTSSGKRLRLKGKGVQHGQDKGDQYVSLKIVLPETLDDELRDAMEGWRERHNYRVRENYGVDG